MFVILIILDYFLQTCRFFQPIPSGWTVPLRLSWRPIELTYCQPDPSRWTVRYLRIRNCNYAFCPGLRRSICLPSPTLDFQPTRSLRNAPLFPLTAIFSSYFVEWRWVVGFLTFSIVSFHHIPCTLLVTAELYHHPLNCIVQAVLRIRIRCLFDSWIRDG